MWISMHKKRMKIAEENYKTGSIKKLLTFKKNVFPDIFWCLLVLILKKLNFE